MYYKLNETEFPTGSKEALGYLVGFAQHVGAPLCYEVLTSDTLKVPPCSQLRSCTKDDPNLRVDLPNGETKPNSEPVKPVVKSVFDSALELVQEVNTPDGVNDQSQGSTPANPIFNPEDLIRKTLIA